MVNFPRNQISDYQRVRDILTGLVHNLQETRLFSPPTIGRSWRFSPEPFLGHTMSDQGIYYGNTMVIRATKDV